MRFTKSVCYHFYHGLITCYCSKNQSQLLFRASETLLSDSRGKRLFKRFSIFYLLSSPEPKSLVPRAFSSSMYTRFILIETTNIKLKAKITQHTKHSILIISLSKKKCTQLHARFITI